MGDWGSGAGTGRSWNWNASTIDKSSVVAATASAICRTMEAGQRPTSNKTPAARGSKITASRLLVTKGSAHGKGTNCRIVVRKMARPNNITSA